MNYSKIYTLTFFVLTVLFIAALFLNDAFFDWAFDKHLNPWSWYSRPIFLIPFCFFAYKNSWPGMSFSLLCLFTSMVWFPKPQILDPEMVGFLEFEKDYLKSNWTLQKTVTSLIVPISLYLLGLAFWKRSVKLGFLVLFLIAMSKILWSTLNSSTYGQSIILPGAIGLILCIACLYYLLKKTKSKNR